jgi:hypothetical protein
MDNLRKRTTVAAAGGVDALHALDQQRADALETTSAPAEVPRPRQLSSELTRRQILAAFATSGVALALEPTVAPVTAQAGAEEPLAYFLKVEEFIESLIEIPATPIKLKHTKTKNSTTDAKYLAGIANIYILSDDQEADPRSVGRCSASFLCFKNTQRFYTDIANFISVDNGLIVSWFTPTTLVDLELDSIIHSMVTECIVVASTKIGVNPFYGETFDLVVSSQVVNGVEQIHFVFTKIP